MGSPSDEAAVDPAVPHTQIIGAQDGLAVAPATYSQHRTFLDGELFKAEELRASLGLPPTTSPAETLGAAFDKPEVVHIAEADGVFVFADQRPEVLRMYRDVSSLRAIFWARPAEGQPSCATSPAALIGPSRVTSGLSRNGLHEYLRLLDIAAPQTLMAGVHAVEAGTVVTMRGAGPVTTEVTPVVSVASGHAESNELVTTLDRLLHDSVSLRLRGAARSGMFLSGGVDSALLCAISARQRPDATALTVGFDGQRFDESAAAARIAQHLGLHHEVLRFNRHELLGAFDRMAQGMDQPMADPATMVTLLAFDHCRQHFDVVLDGTGADEAVGAMPARHVRWAVGVGSLVPTALRHWLVRGMRHVPALAGYTPLFDFEHPAETLMRWKGFTRAEIEELCGEPVSLDNTSFYRTFARYPRFAHYERYSALLNAMPCDRLTQATKLSGAVVRYPFCARSVDSFLRQLPTEWRHLQGQPKRILRELLARYVPPNLWEMPKHGFDFPLQQFLADDNHMLVHRHVLQGRWLQRGFLRPQVVERYAQQYLAGDQQLMFRIWALVVLGAWLDAHEELI